MILGAVLAGGRATRFGTDKALARLGDRTLMDHALATLHPHVAASVIVGRQAGAVPVVPDCPAPGMGPLGGIAGALAHAEANGFAAVLTTACDTPVLPGDLVEALLAAGFGHAAEAPTIGLWPARLAQPLAQHLAAGGDQSIRRWARAAGAAAVLPGLHLPNVNTPADLDALFG